VVKAKAEEVCDYLRSRKARTAPGLSCIPYDDLKAVIAHPGALAGLTVAVNLINSDCIHPEVDELLNTARGLVLEEVATGKLRIVHIQETLTRLSQGIANWVLAPEVRAHPACKNVNFGAGQHDGVTALAWSVGVQSWTAKPGHLTVKTDIMKAHYSISRTAITRTVHNNSHIFSGHYPIIRAALRTGRVIYTDRKGNKLETQQAEGAAVGCPLASILFTITLVERVVDPLLQAYPGLDIKLIEDDIYLHGRAEVVASAFVELKGLLFKECRLQLQALKSAAFSRTLTGWPADTPQEVLEVKFVDGMMVAGTPIGSDNYVFAT
jgi:hypothetical protein